MLLMNDCAYNSSAGLQSIFDQNNRQYLSKFPPRKLGLESLEYMTMNLLTAYSSLYCPLVMLSLQSETSITASKA